MACVSGEAEIEGVAQGVSGMKNEKENIDDLLKRNASEQLAGVNWERLNAAISQKLNQADRNKTYVTRRRYVLRVAAGIAAAAAIVLIVVSIQPQKPEETSVSNAGTTTVELLHRKGSASVEIIDTNGDRRENDIRSSWIIIRVPEPLLADNGVSRDQIDLACLL